MSIHSQKGFTMLELLAATAVAGLILPLVITFTFQVIRGTASINQDLVIQQDLDNASIWFTRDLSQAQTTDLPDDGLPYTTMRVDWTDKTGWGEANPTHSVIYTLSGTNLQRNYDGTINFAARNVSSITFSRNGDFITVSITSTYSGATATLKYNITPRTDNPLEYVAP